MEQMLNNFIKTASTMEKGLFVMVVGLLFVFFVQVVFYVVIKIWPGKKQTSE